MKDPLDDVDIIVAPKDMKCEACGDETKDTILVEGTDELLCTDCYVHRFGLKDFIKNYKPMTRSPRL